MSLSGGGGGGKRKGAFKKKGSDDTKKPPLESRIGHTDDDDNDVDSSREMVTGIGGGKVVTAAPEKSRGPLVIGLTRNKWEDDNKKAVVAAARGTAGSSSPSSGTTAVPAEATEEKSLDQLAAEAIALEARPEGSKQGTKDNNDRYGLGLNSDRVIGIAPVGGKDGRGGGGGQGNDGIGAGGAAAPLLAQNRIPGIAEMDGEDAKFKHDLGYRAEDLSVRSQAYQGDSRACICRRRHRSRTCRQSRTSFTVLMCRPVGPTRHHLLIHPRTIEPVRSAREDTHTHVHRRITTS